jgi:diguanylate cyclase (GGDEF)-like protein/PAS domain S-box-containing protein
MFNRAAANLAALIESTDDLIGSVDLDFRLIAFNQALRKTIAKNRGTQVAMGKRVEDLLPPEVAALFNAHFQRALAEGPFQATMTMLDGRVIEFAYNPIVAGGKKTGVSIFGKDISQRSQAVANLSALIESTADFIWSVDRNYRLITFNGELKRTFEASFGITPVAGMLPGDLLPPERAAVFPPLYERALADGPFRVEYTTVDGRTVEMALNPIVVAGEKTGVSVLGKDISERKAAERALLEAEKKYREIFDGALEGIFQTSPDGRLLTANPALAQMLGYDAQDYAAAMGTDIVPDVWVDPAERSTYLKLLEEKKVLRGYECRFKRKDGSVIWVSLNARATTATDGITPINEGFIEDITERKRTEMQLSASEARYRTVFQTSQDGITISRFDDGKFIEVNQTFLNMVRCERNEVIGRTSTELGLWTDTKIRQEIVEALQRDSSFRNLTIPFRRKDGETFWMQLSASLIEIDGVACILSVTRDTSDIRAAEEKIKDLAFYDQLTHLPNRRLLLERLKGAPGRDGTISRERALLLLDLDEFKKLNDTRGHQVGDLLLKEIARRLTTCVRGADTVARCGGDEFAVLLESLGKIPEPAATHAQLVAGKVVAALGHPYSLAGQQHHCHCSIGITIFGGEPGSPHRVLQQAELALHQAKTEGRNAVRFFAPDLQSAADTLAAMEQDLHQAITRKQFLLYYQPQVDSSGLIGAEALIRWNHPERGLLAPSDFIHLAEETGLILPLGEWTLEAACRQIAAWAHRPQTAQIALAVNISARQFRRPEFVDQVLAVLGRSGADPHCVKLELTESMLLEDVEGVIAKMSALKSHGLRFSLDDFGTGYSSLSYLKRLPLDQLKIDRAFVHDILVDVTSGAIAQTIVSLSRAMGLSVIAEGVETEEQRDFLAHLGCQAFQGYLFGHPLPIEEFEQTWLQST